MRFTKRMPAATFSGSHMSAVRHAVVCDRGRTHHTNEDRWLADAAFGLYAVADGMADAIAPQLAVDHLPGLVRAAFGDTPDLATAEAAPRLRVVVQSLNDLIRQKGEEIAGLFGCVGSTLVLALVDGRRALLAHLGDSRAYLMRTGTLEPMTRDHSHVTAMLDAGRLTEEEAARCRWNGGPTRFLGMAGTAESDVRALELTAGDQLLLCSDGLPYMLRDEEIAAVMGGRTGPAETCRRLVEAANAAGGCDNITALVIVV
jgi:protein phosphatase